MKNSAETELEEVTKILKKMLDSIMSLPKISIEKNQSGQGPETPSSKGSEHDERFLEFIIIPRFLISKEKINKLIKDEELQRNFIFLVANECLGHYNNEANKKLPS